MKTIERVVRNIESIDVENGHVEEGDFLNNETELITETTYDGKRLARFRTGRRKEGGEKAIVESGFSLDRIMGRANLLGSGTHYEKDHVVPASENHGRGQIVIHASRKYPELNELLKVFGI